MGEARALLDGAPLDGDSLEGVLAALRQPALHEPAADHHARSANATSTMNRADPAAPLIILEHLKHLIHILPTPRYPPIHNREPMILHIRLVNPQFLSPGEKVGSIRAQLALLGQVNEGADAGFQDAVEFLAGRIKDEGCPWVFACEECWGGPV